MKRKMKYAGHVLRGSAGVSHLQILEGQVEGIRKRENKRYMDTGYAERVGKENVWRVKEGSGR